MEHLFNNNNASGGLLLIRWAYSMYNNSMINVVSQQSVLWDIVLDSTEDMVDEAYDQLMIIHLN